MLMRIKTIFLDFTCHFIGHMKYDVITILDACNLHPLIGFSRLKEKFLLSIDNF